MSQLAIICFLLVLNFGISWLNAYYCGRTWTESKAIGGWMRFLTWCAAIMSAAGFTSVYLILLAVAAGGSGMLPPEYVRVMLELGYVTIVIPVIGTGLAIWIDSLIEAWKRRDALSVGVAVWNTYAQVQNMRDAATHMPGMVKHLSEVFSGDSDGDGLKAKFLFAAVLLVALALLSGAFTTAAIIRRTSKKYAHEIFDNAKGQPA